MKIDQREVDFIIGVSNALMRSITVPADKVAFSLRLEEGDSPSVYLDTLKKVGKTYKVKLLCDYDPADDLIDVYIMKVNDDSSAEDN